MADIDKVISALECLSSGGGTYDCLKFPCPYGFYGYTDCHKWEIARDALELLKEQPQIVRCKDCKHRPKEPNWETYESGFDIEFPEGSKCPCRCSNDEWYSWYPEDNWFCADGERRENNE